MSSCACSPAMSNGTCASASKPSSSTTTIPLPRPASAPRSSLPPNPRRAGCASAPANSPPMAAQSIAFSLNPAVGWAVRCVTWDGTTGHCGSGGVEANGRFELPAMQVMSQCFTEDPIPPPERIQLLRTLPQSGHEAGDTQISPACQMLLAMRAADGQLYLTRMVGPPRQSGEQ